MLISDVSVRRPVFAAVISLILVIIGLMSVRGMQIREYPDIQRPIVSISTTYRGAASDIVERRVTQVLEDQLAGISGITKMSSVSYDERSTITIEFSRDRDIDAAANDVRDRVGRVLSLLPDEADPPEVSRMDARSETTMWIDVSDSVPSDGADLHAVLFPSGDRGWTRGGDHRRCERYRSRDRRGAGAGRRVRHSGRHQGRRRQHSGSGPVAVHRVYGD